MFFFLLESIRDMRLNDLIAIISYILHSLAVLISKLCSMDYKENCHKIIYYDTVPFLRCNKCLRLGMLLDLLIKQLKRVSLLRGLS